MVRSSKAELLRDVIADFNTSQEELNSRLNLALRGLDDTFRELDDVVRMHKTQLQEYNRLVELLRDLEKTEQDPKVITGFWRQLMDIKEMLDQLKASKPRTGSMFLRYTLGHVNMRVWKKSDILQMKIEYNKFKRENTNVFIVFCVLYACVSWKDFGFYPLRLVGVLQQLFMLYFYASLALRENILQVNGSEIKDWWIQHHYLSMSLAILILLLPEKPAQNMFVRYCNCVLLFQGIVMVVQNAYQDGRHYVRTTLGKAKPIDPSAGETIVEKPVGLKILIPLLFIDYLAFFVMSFWALSLSLTERSIQLGLISVVVFSIALGNTLTTSIVLFSKHKDMKMKNYASSKEL